MAWLASIAITLAFVAVVVLGRGDRHHFYHFTFDGADRHHFTFDGTASNTFPVTLESGEENVLDLPTGMIAGAVYQWHISQPAAGVGTLTYAEGFKWPSGVAPKATPVPGAVDLISCVAASSSVLRCSCASDPVGGRP